MDNKEPTTSHQMAKLKQETAERWFKFVENDFVKKESKVISHLTR